MLNETAGSSWAYWTSPDTITAYSTLVLCIATFLLVAVTALYVGEVRKQAKDMKGQAENLKRQANAMEAQSNFIRGQSEAITRQADTMENQFEIIREESATMTRQANAMEGQSSIIREQATAMKKQADAMREQSAFMVENMNYDRLVKRHERVGKEMSSLIGLLYSRRKDPHIFSLTRRSQRVVPSGAWQSGHNLIFDFVSFWDSIDQNMYLNRSIDLRDTYQKYNETIDEYFDLSAQNRSQER